MQSWNFYYHHLERVSRSFSFCIAQLESPHREWIALSYLLFRVADTIEDYKWPSLNAQCQKFAEFKQGLSDSQSQIDFSNWFTEFPCELNKGELQLLKDLPPLLADFFSLEEDKRTQIYRNISQMMAGMQHFLSHHSQDGELVLQDNFELNQYCFFVAGLVGELLTFFFIDLLDELQPNQTILRQSFHFGLFLQKINILKDQLSDEALGRHFVPNREILRASIYDHAVNALAYIKLLPINSGRNCRLFCAWSLFIGLASLKWIDKSYTLKKRYKISYAETMAIIFKLKRIIDNNHALTKLFEQYISPIQSSPLLNNTSLPKWLSDIYPDPILAKYASELGLSAAH